MTAVTSKNISLFLLRVALGLLFFKAGIVKVFDPKWTAAGYLQASKILPDFYQWFAGAHNIAWVNLLNEWGLTLLGVALITGLFVRVASIGGIMLMVLYYIPNIVPGTVIIDEHIIYSLALAVLISCNSGQFWGLDFFTHKLKP